MTQTFLWSGGEKKGTMEQSIWYKAWYNPGRAAVDELNSEKENDS